MRATYVPYTSQLRELPCLSPPGEQSANPVLAVVVLCFGGLAAALTQTLVIPIQSELPRLLHTSPANTSWVVTITLLAAAVAMPIAGRVADLVGKQRVLVVSAGILLVGLGRVRPGRLAGADARRPRAAGDGDGLHPGRHLADARDHAAARSPPPRSPR